MRGSDQTNRRPLTPLFQVQASGWPFIAQSRIGISFRWASTTASQNVGRHGTSRQRSSSRFGVMCERHFSKVSPVRSWGAAAARIARARVFITLLYGLRRGTGALKKLYEGGAGLLEFQHSPEPEENMHVLTRGDLDGLTSTVLLSLVEKITEVRFAHPKDVQDGKIPCDKEDIVVNLPYVKGCGMWFDHHVSEERKVSDIGKFKGRFAVAPSAARVVSDHYKRPEFDRFKELLEATDRLDSAQLSPADVAAPEGWILLGYTLDPRTGLGPEFQKYFRWLVEYVKEVPLSKILKHPEVKKRCDRVTQEQEDFKKLLKKHSKLDKNVVVTDFRSVQDAPVGNRFLIYTLYPESDVEVRIFGGKAGKTVNVAVGHSIFRRTCKVSAGDLCASYGGGGHFGAGTCQLDPSKAEKQIAEILKKLKA